MSKTVIRIENLSKQYRLGKVSLGTFSHDFNRWWHSIRGKEDPYLKIGETNDRTTTANSDYVWVLRNVGFEVQKGEVLGIIGHNGAGKSTLLKILSRTTAPTLGNIKIRGRLASLLEVGTGFHPELSGRENIFLNGAILGMTKNEIRRKFDEIVDFAGVERYIDTPVKRYSSGMYVRLAFAVAAHLESEILIVDEVLAVGDAEFQKKALGKMKDVSNSQGRTVLFVSHNMNSLKTLCTKGLLLQTGMVMDHGDIHEVVNRYLSSTFITQDTQWVRKKIKKGPHFKEISIELHGEQPNHELDVQFTCVSDIKDLRPAIFSIDIKNETGVVIMQAIPELYPFISFKEQNEVSYGMKIDLLGLVPGKYYMSFWIGPHNNETYDNVDDIVCFEISASPIAGRTFPHTPDHGNIVAPSGIYSYQHKLGVSS